MPLRAIDRLRLSRRRALGALAAAGWSLVASCSGPNRSNADGMRPAPTSDPTAQPSSTSTSGSAHDTEATATNTVPILDPTPRHNPLDPTEPPEDPTAEPTAISTATPASEAREIRVEYAAVTSRRLQVRNISFEDLRRLWAGEIANWGEFGDPLAPPVTRYTFPNSALPIDPFGGDVEVAGYDELAEALWHDRGGIALVPRNQVDFRVRTLHIDSEDILRHPNSERPLALQLYGVPEEIAPETLEARPQPAMLTFVGDIIFGRFVHQRLEALGDFAASFRAIADELKVADLTIGNLECSLSDSFPQPELENPRTFLFKTGTQTVAGLELAEIDILSRANNHSFNFGAIGMDDTTETLDRAGILHFGMGHNLAEARQPAIASVGETSFAFLGYDGVSSMWDGAGENHAGIAPMIDWMVAEDVARAAEAGHVVIPFFHWGIEYVSIPTEEQRYIARVAIDAGAAIVIGSHPHWVQAVETYNGKAIVYSLGNFVFDQSWSRETMEGMYANIWFEGARVLGIDLVAVLIEEDHRPRLMNEWEAHPVLERVWEASDIVRSWG